MPEVLDIYSYLTIGTGPTGCLPVSRPSTNPANRALLLEAGDPNSYPWIYIPVGYLYHTGNPRIDWCSDTDEVSGFNGRSLKYPRGKVLGGCFLINGMIYMRNQARDYGQWVVKDNSGWSWRELLPLFRRIEDHFVGINEMHGAGGEWRVKRQRLSWKLLDAFQQAAAQTGIVNIGDFNGSNNEDCGYFQVNQRDGMRWNASEGFLCGIIQHTGLTVLTHAEAQRVFLRGGRAKALSVRWQGREQRFEARREIVLSVGAIDSPCLLQCSGTGPQDLLERLSAEIVHELPGVGDDLQDHLQLRMIHRVDDVPALDQITGGLWDELGMGLRYLASRSEPLLIAPSQPGAFACSDPQQPSVNPEYHVQPLSLGRLGESLHAFPAFTASVYGLRPHNRRTVRVRSFDPDEAPLIQPNHLSNPCDLKVATDAICLTRRIAATPALATFHPQEYKPGSGYRSEEGLQRVAAEIGTTIFHPAGACRVGQGPQAVADAQLRVHGIPGLRITDASIVPSLTSGSTCSPVPVIAEKTAQMILAERHREAAPQVVESAMATDGKEAAKA